MTGWPAANVVTGRFEPVLGTTLSLRFVGDPRDAPAVESAVLQRAETLEGLLSRHRPATAMSRWMRGQPDTLTRRDWPELVEVLELGRSWHDRSGGAFHPATGGLTRHWRDAAGATAQGTPAGAAPAVGSVPYRVEIADGPHDRVVRMGSCGDVDLDGVAKGWVVDRLAEVTLPPSTQSLLINVGGDLRLVGDGEVTVAIENPVTAVDNAAPLGVVRLRGGGLASSGNARRGYQNGNRWVGHVLDPRSGGSVGRTLGVTVVAPTTAQADALSTVLGVRGPDERSQVLLREEDAHACVVGPDGSLWTDPGWEALVVSGFGP